MRLSLPGVKAKIPGSWQRLVYAYRFPNFSMRHKASKSAKRGGDESLVMIGKRHDEHDGNHSSEVQFPGLLQQSKYGDACRGSHIDPAVGNHGHDEFIVHELIARAGLVAIVKLRFQVGRCVCMQRGWN